VPDELWKMNLDGSNKVQLTHFPKKIQPQRGSVIAGPPQWNNKHNFISYLSRQKQENQIYAVTRMEKAMANHFRSSQQRLAFVECRW
jgi:hypothetical protein